MNKPKGGSENDPIGKEKLLHILKKLLDTDLDLGFLRHVDEKSLEQLVAVVRARMEEER